MPDVLPIDAHLSEIGGALRAHGAAVLVAEPGAGKTTRVPPFLADAGLSGRGQVVVLQPRRVAARAAAARIAAERGEEPGGFAGYHVRFDRRASAATRVLVVTEGVLTRRMQDDPELSGVGAVVLDEFHERSLHADLAAAFLGEIRASLRPDLRVLVMSATLDAEPAAAFFGGVPILRVPGRAHPLTIDHLDVPDDRPPAIRAAAGVRRMLDLTAGDILVFLPGLGEIARAAEALDSLARERNLSVLPLHGELRAEDQDAALRPGPRRKIVLATNVAETSVTVPGVTGVVDVGLARQLIHDPDSGLDRLELRRISRASATQRAGRAGRTAPGRVLRLWTKSEETAMPAHETPEIRRVDLASTALDVRIFGQRDLATFGWYEAPSAASLASADQLLVRLGALEPQSLRVTKLGEEIARIPAHPRIARLLLEAAARGVGADGALCAALLSERDLLPRGASPLPTGPSDLLARRDLFLDGERGSDRGTTDRNARRTVARTAEQFRRFADRSTMRSAAPSDDVEDALLRSLLAAYPDRVARRRRPGSADASMVGGRAVALAPESVVKDAELFLVLEGDFSRRAGSPKALVRLASRVERAWIEELAGAPLRPSVETFFDDARGRVVGRKVVRFEDLVLEEGETGAPDPNEAARLLMDAAKREPRTALGLTDEAVALLGRVRALREWMPELELPPHDEQDLVAALESWIDGATSLDRMKAIDLRKVVLGRMSRRQRAALDEQAPEAIVVPSGMRRALVYEAGRPPVLAVKLQELFGLADTPRVGAGRVPVVLHLLSPNGRPVQVTQDLRSFWNTTYPEARRELRGRYPRHPWPDDPWNAAPTHRAKPRGT